jgi:predicted phosphodiesterase
MPSLLRTIRLGVLAAALVGCSGAADTAERTGPTAPVTPPDTSAPAPVIPPPSGEFQTAVPTIDLNVILARPTATGITMSIMSGSARDVRVTWSPGNGDLTRRVAAGIPLHLPITGLAANQSYRYRVAAGSSVVDGVMRTARSRGQPFRFVMQADSHLDAGSSLPVYTAALGNMVSDSADFLVDLGDTFMTDKYAAYQNALAQFYAQRHYFGLVGRTTPLFMVQGNHDGEQGWQSVLAPWSATQRLRYFPGISAGDSYSGLPGAPNAYAFAWGDATFIMLDPFAATAAKPGSSGWDWTLGKAQYDWLAATLAQSTTPFTFVFLHHLVGGIGGAEARGGAEASVLYEWGGRNADGTAGFATRRAGWSRPVHDLLRQYGVTAVFHGHDHLYVQQSRDGITYQEVPQPSFARENATTSATDYGYLSGTLLGSSGHVRVSVNGTQAVVEYVRARAGAGNGDVIHRYILTPLSRQ